MTLSERAARYNKREFSPESRRRQDSGSIDFHPALRVGEPTPDFTIFDLEGRSVRLSGLHDKAHVVFAFGCMTAPIFINGIPDLNRLHRSFGHQGVGLHVIYVREAHAAENYGMKRLR